MEAQTLANHVLLMGLAEEEHKASGWKGVVGEWMQAYEDYFDTDEEEDRYAYDDGLGLEHTEREAMVDTAAVCFGRAKFCVTRSYVEVPGRNDNTCCLCTMCYFVYLDYHSLMRGVDHGHRHVVTHTTVYPAVVRHFRDICSSCCLPLKQVVAREACVTCNDF